MGCYPSSPRKSKRSKKSSSSSCFGVRNSSKVVGKPQKESTVSLPPTFAKTDVSSKTAQTQNTIVHTHPQAISHNQHKEKSNNKKVKHENDLSKAITEEENKSIISQSKQSKLNPSINTDPDKSPIIQPTTQVSQSQEIIPNIDLMSKNQNPKDPYPEIISESTSLENISGILPGEKNKIIHFIDEENSSNVYLYYLETKQFKEIKIKNPTIRGYDTIIFKNKLYMAGGESMTGQPIKHTYAMNFDKSPFKLQKKAKMLISKSNHTMIEASWPIIYSIGGFNLKGILKDTQLYNCFQNCWIPAPMLNEKKSLVSATYFLSPIPSKHLSICRIYIFGGEGDDGEMNSIEYLNLEKDGLPKADASWKKLNIQISARSKAGSMQINENSIIIFGGDQAGEDSNDSFIFDTTQNEIRQSTQLNKGDWFGQRHGGIFDGSLFFFGLPVFIHSLNCKTMTWNLTFMKETEKFNEE